MLGPVDIPTAEKWFEAGVRMHDPIAAYNLGSLYSVDRIHPHDTRKAVALMRRSTADGYVPAMHSLALLLINHPQEEQTSDEARSLLEAASAGVEVSIILGILARDGEYTRRQAVADVYFHRQSCRSKPAGDLHEDISTLVQTSTHRSVRNTCRRAGVAQHSQVSSSRRTTGLKLFPLPENTSIIRDTFAPGETASSAKEAPWHREPFL
jgi:TPR repeat protein